MGYNRYTDSASIINERQGLYYFQMGLKEILTDLPKISGMNYWTPYESHGGNTVYSSMVYREYLSLQTMFCACRSIETVPETLLEWNSNKEIFAYLFAKCISLTSIPQNLFKCTTAVKDFSSCFYACDALEDFDIRIGSSVVENAANFVDKKVGCERVVRVPRNSTTYNTFDALADELGLTVIGE